MAHRLSLLSLVFIAALLIAGGMLLSTPTRAATEPTPIACPNKQTVILSGSGAPPNEGLLVYLRARSVGGGSTSPAGSWSIPLRVNERPGIYPVEVRLRSSRAVLARFTCYVDVPLDITETPQPTPTLTVDPATPEASATSRPTTAATAATPTGTGETTATVTSGTATVTGTRTSGTATVTPTGTRTTATPTGTTTAGTSGIKINDVICRAPSDDPYTEYIELRNDSTSSVNISGWKIINASRSGISYIFPSYTIDRGPDVYIVLYSDIDTDSPDSGEFYWGRNDQLWLAGNKAELRDQNNNLISQYTVTCSS